MPSEIQLILRLLLAGGLAGALGVERELTDQPAGLRTHILVGLGACLFAIISAYGFETAIGGDTGGAVRVDVTRVASQIVVGIGFLAGGVILKSGATIRGLTTAANLWITAAIGTAVGLGSLVLGAVTTAIVLAALVGLRPLRGFLERRAADRAELVLDTGPDVDLGAVLAAVRKAGAAIREVRISESADERVIRLLVRLPRGTHGGDVAATLARVPDVRNVDWSG